MTTRTQAAAPAWLRLDVAAWTLILGVSALPDALFHELAGGAPEWLKWVKLGLLASVTVLALAWEGLRPLRYACAILLGIFAAESVLVAVQTTETWKQWWGGETAGFAASMGGIQAGRLLVTLCVIGLMLVLGYRRADFFLTPGQLDAPIEPVRWLGFPKADPWTRFGGMWAIFVGLGLLVFLLLGGRPTAGFFLRVVPLLPVVLLFAVTNAFSEEMTYRASLLAGLAPAVGARPALWMTAAFFGLGHYFGVPYGVLGAVLAGFLGWLLGKAMLETRGLFWAWFIHFVQDVLIFSFMAAGSVTPGG